jgi:phage portal protein BeeE
VGHRRLRVRRAGCRQAGDRDPPQVIHFKLANPHSPYYGLGLIQGAGRAADLELALTDSQASYFENHAMPSLAVQSDRRVPRDVFKKIRAQLRARTQGSRNAGELLVLEAGLKLAAGRAERRQAGLRGALAHVARPHPSRGSA